ncbi:hypothetical protein BpHYR1_001377 [Brachionus plicatilis]|uniref:Uncharacterized protein n=1 Tax=Brachionus plicatilis TaxID=10195 RepID=A0A3M7PDQ9_BRAPC|nr:hypothetical protein BpHYR1_001377 [Brachionus plicatilis]
MDLYKLSAKYKLKKSTTPKQENGKEWYTELNQNIIISHCKEQREWLSLILYPIYPHLIVDKKNRKINIKFDCLNLAQACLNPLRTHTQITKFDKLVLDMIKIFV